MQTIATALPSFFTTFVKPVVCESGWFMGRYCVCKLFTSKDSLPPIQSFALFGAFIGGLNVLVDKIYEVGVGLLREDNANDEAGKTISSRLRQGCWKIINSVDSILDKIDALVSDKLRTCKAKLNIHNELGRMSILMLEVIMRFAFWKSITSTACSLIMTNLSNRALEKIGYQSIRKMQIGPKALVADKGIHIQFASCFITRFILHIVMELNREMLMDSAL